MFTKIRDPLKFSYPIVHKRNFYQIAKIILKKEKKMIKLLMSVLVKVFIQHKSYDEDEGQ